MKRVERAIAQFETGSACSQSVAVAFADEIGIDEDTVHRSMTSFGGGVAGTQQICGAVVAGVFVLSARHGDSLVHESRRKAHAKKKTQQFLDAVETRLGSTECRGILETSLEDADETGLFATRCVDAVRICTEEIEKRL